MTSHDSHTRRLLTEIERREGVTQRQLAEELQIALGLTNLLVKRIVSKGWVKVVNVKANRLSYLITPAGIAEKAKMTRDYFNNTVHLYTETRERLQERLFELEAELEGDDKRIVFYGAGEVAEIGYISLQGTGLELVGVVDDRPKRRDFFGVPIRPASSLSSERQLDGTPFNRLAVMSFRNAASIRGKLAAVQFPADSVFWL